jgi:hypothetical protein
MQDVHAAALGFYHFANFAGLNQIYRNWTSVKNRVFFQP